MRRKASSTPKPEPKHVIVTFEIGKGEFDSETEDLKKMRAHVESIACPICGNANLELVAYEKGTEGWEAAISCKSCFVKGVFNDGGFRIVKPYQIPVRER